MLAKFCSNFLRTTLVSILRLHVNFSASAKFARKRNGHFGAYAKIAPNPLFSGELCSLVTLVSL